MISLGAATTRTDPSSTKRKYMLSLIKSINRCVDLAIYNFIDRDAVIEARVEQLLGNNKPMEILFGTNKQ